MSKCFLKGHGICSDKISGEHYVSASVLRAIAPDGFLGVAGHSWQVPNTFQGIGIKGLQSNILCTFHNSALSGLDEEAANFVERVFASNKKLDDLTEEVNFDGEKIERWMLKTLFSLSASSGLNCAPLADRHKEVLMGAPWPDGLGLYAVADPSQSVATPDLRIEVYPHPTTRELLAASFLISGVKLWLLLDHPKDLQAFGVSRPRGFIYKHNSLVRTINLLWPNGLRNLAVVFTRIGTTDELQPHMLLMQKTIKPRKGR